MKGLIQRVEIAGNRTQGAADELVEIPRAVLVWVIGEDPCHVEVGGEPDDILHAVGAKVGPDLLEFCREPPGEEVSTPSIATFEHAAGVCRERHAGEDRFPGCGRRREPGEQPPQLGGTQHGFVRPVRVGVGAAILARVEQEEFQMFAPTELSVQPQRLFRCPPDGEIIEKGFEAQRRQGFGRSREVVAHFMIVPYRIHRHRRQQLAQRAVFALIAVLRPAVLLGRRDKIGTRNVWRGGAG